MPLTERIEHSITVLPTGHLEVRVETVILRDGEPITAPQYQRHVLAPGDDLSNEHPEVVAHAAIAWTPERVAAVEASRASLLPSQSSMLDGAL